MSQPAEPLVLFGSASPRHARTVRVARAGGAFGAHAGTRATGGRTLRKGPVGALIRAAERWRGLRFTEFELRQIAAIRKELDDEYHGLITPLAR